MDEEIESGDEDEDMMVDEGQTTQGKKGGALGNDPFF
jgi:hypothetical protein